MSAHTYRCWDQNPTSTSSRSQNADQVDMLTRTCACKCIHTDTLTSILMYHASHRLYFTSGQSFPLSKNQRECIPPAHFLGVRVQTYMQLFRIARRSFIFSYSTCGRLRNMSGTNSAFMPLALLLFFFVVCQSHFLVFI